MKRRLASVFVAIIMIVCFGLEAEAHYHRHDYHFGARQYNAATMLWSSPDSKQEDYTPLSPLSYCAANPIRFIDPMGEDLYQYNNQTGKLNFIKNDDVRDYVQIVDNKGDVILKNLIPLERSYAKGVLSYQHSPKYDKDKRYSVVKIRGDENGLEIFKFLSENITLYSEIEFSLAQTGIRGEKGLNFLTTSSERGQERGFGYLYATQIIEGYTINRHYHSHPKGKHFGEKDKELAASLIKHAVDLKRRKPLIFLYYTPTKQMIKKKEQE